METRSTRRNFMLGAAAALGPFQLMRKAAANPLAPGAQVPVVDSLSIRVLMDSSHDIFLNANGPKAVRIRRFPRGSDFRKTLHNQWGLSLALESKAGADTRRVLLDFGYTPEALIGNMEIMGVDPSRFDAMVLSHGHFDHWGGMDGFLKKFRGVMKQDITLYAGGEDNFCSRMNRTAQPGHYAEFGMLDRRDVTGHRVNLVLCEKPVVVHHAFTTGAIRRAGIERVLPNTVVEYAKKGAAGCDMTHFTEAEKLGKIVPDEHVHEHGTCYHLRGKGLVVFNSCGHVGILNTIRQAMEVSGVKKLHAMVGGFHLAVAPEDYVKQIVSELKALDPDVVIPMHCSGLNFALECQRQMPDRLALSTTGSEFVFGA